MPQLWKKVEPDKIFVSLAKCRKRPTKQLIDYVDGIWDRFKKEGGTVLHAYWTIGRYDAFITLETPDEKSALRALRRGVTCSALKQC